jgi:allantoin racemase
MKILVVNPNTSVSMTESIARSARRAASPGTEILAVQPFFGPEAIDCNLESYLSAVAVMDRILAVREPYDAVVLAGFGEHGREGVQEITDVPVLDIAESSAHVAQMIGRSYSVVTTLARSVGPIEDRLRLAGLADRCASVRSCGLSTAEVDADPPAAVAAILAEAERAVREDRAEVICLGCGGMAGLEEAITGRLGVPVVDGVAAGVRLAEAVAGMGLRTSKVCTYAAPPDRPIPGWPLSRRVPTSSTGRTAPG